MKVPHVPPKAQVERMVGHVVVHYHRDGTAHFQKWPRRRPRAERNPTTAQQVARWDAAQVMVKRPLARELEIARERTNNTAFYTRDLLISSMYGNTISWPGYGWRYYKPD